MKLIRLTTTDNDGEFNNEFNANIEIKPFSKIALNSISLEPKTDEIIINDDNDSISHQYNEEDGLIECKIANGIYNAQNQFQIFINIQKALNLTLRDTGNQIGNQWQIGQNRFTNRVSLQLNRAGLTEPGTNWNYNNIQITGDTNNKTFTSTETFDDTDENQMNYDTPFCKGGAVFRARIDTLDPEDDINPTADTDGFYFGLSLELPSNLGGTVPVRRLAYGIRATSHNQKYSVVIAGTEFDHTTPICNDVDIYAVENNPGNVNDIIQISYNLGYVELKVYKNGNPNAFILNRTKIPSNFEGLDFYPAIVFRGAAQYTVLSQVRFTADPIQELLSVSTNVDNGTSLGFSPPSQTNKNKKMYLNIGSQSLATYLGFKNQRSPRIGFVNSPIYTYDGDVRFLINDSANSFMLELTNINLESYDSLSKKRKNILAVIPKEQNLKGSIVYETNNLIWLDINNANAFNLRNITARLIKNDLSKMDINGIAIATVIIKGADE